MEIRNIYEDYSGERLYSVLLDENELSLFSAAGQAVLARRAANKLSKTNWQIESGKNSLVNRVRRGAIKTLGHNPDNYPLSREEYLRLGRVNGNCVRTGFKDILGIQ